MLAILRRLETACADGSLFERLHYLWRAWRAVRVIAPSGSFDADWYARDGTLAGSPRRLIWHYVLRGAHEGRSPSAAFDTASYLRAHPQVGLAGLNPLAHYLTKGRSLGLRTHPAPRAALPRQVFSQAAYTAWTLERSCLDAPVAARLQAGVRHLPPLAVNDAAAADAAHILLMPDGVTLAETALLHLRAAIAAAPEADLLYADEDFLAPDGSRRAPWFKPDFDPELLRAGDLLGPATVFRRTLLGKLGWDGQVPDATELRRMTDAAAALRCPIHHVPRILFHRSRPPGLSAPAAPLPDPRPLVSIIMPTRDHAALLRKAARGVLQETDYEKLELLIVDNGSSRRATFRLFAELAADPRVRILPAPGRFNWSAINNQAARAAHGDILVLLNNDVEIISPGWLGEIVARAAQPGIGAVGAKLLYPDGSLQHAGMTIDGNGCFSHILRGAPADSAGISGEMLVARTVAAVTGACLAIRRDLFFEVGGLEADRLAVTCNDIDLCLRVRHAGYRVVYTPHAVLVHREAASRGHDVSTAQMARVLGERDYLRRRWGELATRDPYLNPNLCLLNARPALEAPSAVWGGCENAHNCHVNAAALDRNC
jgi:GT2 family glycosyltransferase